jgi:hypothetical protein
MILLPLLEENKNYYFMQPFGHLGVVACTFKLFALVVLLSD